MSTNKQKKYFIYGHTRNSQDPLDPRLKINSLTTINTELLLQYRYNGLIFHVKDIDKVYVFLNDLNNPVDLSQYISGNIVFGISDNDENYSDLVTNLNNTNPTLGSLVTVFPLGVTFNFDGQNWKYFSGSYKVADDATLLTIPVSLREVNKEIYINDELFLFDATLNKSTPIIVIEGNQFPAQPIHDRYYENNGIFFYSFAGKLLRLGDKVYFGGIQLVKGENIVQHNLSSILLQATLSIQVSEGATLSDTRSFELPFEIVDSNRIKFESKFNWTSYATLYLRAIN